MRKFLFAYILLCTGFSAAAQQQEAMEKEGLLLERCVFAPQATMLVLRDEAEWTVNADMSLHLERSLLIRFFKDRKGDKTLSDIIFYLSPAIERYQKLTAVVVDIDGTTKAPVHRDPNARLNNTHLDQTNLKLRAGTLLHVSYSMNFAYDEKLPAWRFQAMCPTDFSSIKLTLPYMVQIAANVEGSYKTELQKSTPFFRPMKVDNNAQNINMTERYYQMNQLPAYEAEPFSDNSPLQLARLRMIVRSVIAKGKLHKDFAKDQQQKIFEQLSSRPDYLLRLAGRLDIKNDYDRHIRSLSDKEEKLARIYDLVRRRIRWTGVDSLYAHNPLAKVWDTRKGNSTEINLTLTKLLQTYGYDAQPLILGTRGYGTIDSEAVALDDFNRTVVYVKMKGKNIVLDATAYNYDYPIVPPDLLNSRGLLISIDTNRLVEIFDTTYVYKNAVTELGHFSFDTFRTNVYINSSGYAKAGHLDIIEKDSLKGLRQYFEHGNRDLRIRHFMVANEYVDTLPLAQEFDIKIPLDRKDNLGSLRMTWFHVPDTLLSIQEGRHTAINFGYKQQYELVSEYTYPEDYEVYLMPDNTTLSALAGTVRFSREYHHTGSNFTLRQTLSIDKTQFNMAESLELAKFLKKIAYLNGQNLMLKKNN